MNANAFCKPARFAAEHGESPRPAVGLIELALVFVIGVLVGVMSPLALLPGQGCVGAPLPYVSRAPVEAKEALVFPPPEPDPRERIREMCELPEFRRETAWTPPRLPDTAAVAEPAPVEKAAPLEPYGVRFN